MKKEKNKKQNAKVVPDSRKSMRAVKMKAVLAGVVGVAAVLFIGCLLYTS